MYLSTRPARTRGRKRRWSCVPAAESRRDSNVHLELAVSPCTGCRSPRHGVELPPNGMQKKSPRKTRKITGTERSNRSLAHGATEKGRIFRPVRSKVTGPRWPPVSVTNASTRGERIRHDACPKMACFTVECFITVPSIVTRSRALYAFGYDPIFARRFALVVDTSRCALCHRSCRRTDQSWRVLGRIAVLQQRP